VEGKTSDGEQFLIPLAWEWPVYLNKPCDEAQSEWRDAPLGN
jgi:hypothetical protein